MSNLDDSPDPALEELASAAADCSDFDWAAARSRLTDPSHHRLARELETIAALSRALDLGAAELEKLAAPAAPAPSPPPSAPAPIRLKAGDEEARDRLIGRYFRPLCRWAHGRLPANAFSMSETQDLVQDAILRVLRHLETFEPERPGALHAYLRKAVLNRILDELRSARRGPRGVELDDSLPSHQPSPYEMAAKQEDREIFEAALEDLRDEERELIIARVEWGLDYDDIAAALGKPTANAARVGVRRAVLKLAGIMDRRRHRDEQPG